MNADSNQALGDSTSMSQEEKASFLEQLFIHQAEEEQNKNRGLDFSSFTKPIKKNKKRRRINHLPSYYYSSLLKTQFCLYALAALFIVFICYLNRAFILSLTPFLFIFYLVNVFLFKGKTSNEKYEELLSLKGNKSRSSASMSDIDTINETNEESELEQCLLLNI